MNHSHLKQCIEACWNCRNTCQKTLYGHCLKIGKEHVALAHVKLMVDCIQICQTAADFMTRESHFHQSVCSVCAQICEACAQSCNRIQDEEMKECAQVCQHCAKECQTISAS